METERRDARLVRMWLWLGVVMVFFQIVLGGVTRLTGSGLSITRWDIVTGTIPPLNAADWQEAFVLYQQTPQYLQINEGMELSQFKFIYFWEYLHRLWARTMGFVFLIPFLFFLFRKSLRKETIHRLGIVVLLAGLAAVFGWIMVASGLIERPWVNAYKLTIHLSLGISLFIYLVYTWMKEKGIRPLQMNEYGRNQVRWLLWLVMVQILLGGLVSGMKAALVYPTWPSYHGEWLPSILLDTSQWDVRHFLLYDKSAFMPALVQFLHRNLAYVIVVVGCLYAIRWLRSLPEKWISYTLLGIILVQVVLGILTLLDSIGSIPVLYGALHQAIGILFITFIFYILIRSRSTENNLV